MNRVNTTMDRPSTTPMLPRPNMALPARASLRRPPQPARGPSTQTRPLTTATATARLHHRPRIPWLLGVAVAAACVLAPRPIHATAIPPTTARATPLLSVPVETAAAEPQQIIIPLRDDGSRNDGDDGDGGMGWGGFGAVARRANESLSTDSGGAAAIATGGGGQGSTSAAASSPTPPATVNALPQPLDGALSSSFTLVNGVDTCLNFLESFLKDDTFKACYPFSLLLKGSTSFFQAEKSVGSISQVLDATCAANATACNTYLAGLADDLTASANCGTDYAAGNSQLVGIYTSLVSYAPLYSAACLKDPTTSVYCFAGAITNLTDGGAGADVYFLPLNESLPSSADLPCDACLQRIMGVFQAATADRQQPIALTYTAGAAAVDDACGSGFANATLPEAIIAAATSGDVRQLQVAAAGGGLGAWLPVVMLAVAVALSTL